MKKHQSLNLWKINDWRYQTPVFENQSLISCCPFFIFDTNSIIHFLIFWFLIFHFWTHFSFFIFDYWSPGPAAASPASHQAQPAQQLFLPILFRTVFLLARLGLQRQEQSLLTKTSLPQCSACQPCPTKTHKRKCMSGTRANALSRAPTLRMDNLIFRKCRSTG